MRPLVQLLRCTYYSSDSIISSLPDLVAAPVWSGELRSDGRMWQSTWQLQSRALSSGPGTLEERAGRLIDQICSNPQLQEALFAALPSNMRKPEVIQSLANTPELRAKVVEAMVQHGIGPQLLEKMDDTLMNRSLEYFKEFGSDVHTLLEKMRAHPGLMLKFQDPRIMKAFKDICMNEDNLANYADDREVLAVYFQAREVLGPMALHGPPTLPPEYFSSSSLSPSSNPSDSNVKPTSQGEAADVISSWSPGQGLEKFPGSSPQTLQIIQDGLDKMGVRLDTLQQLMMNRPELLEKLQSPAMQQAVKDMSESKWKMAKHFFNPEVMGVLKELKVVLEEAKQMSKNP